MNRCCLCGGAVPKYRKGFCCHEHFTLHTSLNNRVDTMCPVCGVAFSMTRAAFRGGRRCCSPECGKIQRARTQSQTQRKPENRLACRECGRPFYRRGGTGNANLYCSRDCVHRRARELGAADELEKLEASILATPRHCKVCGAESGGRQFCGRGCEYYHYRASMGVYTKTCGECGVQFSVWRPEPVRGPIAPYCTDECRAAAEHKMRRIHNRNAKARRRARIYGARHESVDVLSVLARDRWRCQICGRPTPRKLRGTIEPDAPELDHIVPLAAGGPHTYANVQCACRACNNAKGDGSMLSQMRLELMAT